MCALSMGPARIEPDTYCPDSQVTERRSSQIRRASVLRVNEGLAQLEAALNRLRASYMRVQGIGIVDTEITMG